MCTADVLNDHAHSCKHSLQQLAHKGSTYYFKTQLANTQKNDKTDNQHTHKLEIVPSRAEFINPLQPWIWDAHLHRQNMTSCLIFISNVPGWPHPNIAGNAFKHQGLSEWPIKHKGSSQNWVNSLVFLDFLLTTNVKRFCCIDVLICCITRMNTSTFPLNGHCVTVYKGSQCHFYFLVSVYNMNVRVWTGPFK